MNITVLGAGAIGSLWAYKLSQAGHNVSVWTRDSGQNTVTIKLDEHPSKEFTANNSTAIENCDILLITVKAWQVKQALLPILSQVHSDTILVFMHNGMGAVDEIQAEIERFPVVLATTTHGAYKPETNKVMHTGHGTTQFGAYNRAGEQCNFLSEVFLHALPEVIWNKKISDALWNKLAINCAINPLTAIYQVTNGELSEKKYQVSLTQIVEEVALVMSAEGIQTDKATLLEKVNAVISATAKNHSSMQQDIYYKRTSEIDYINGYLCRTAEKHSITTPENKKLYNQIKQIEQGWR